MSDHGDPFDLDEIRFSSDDDKHDDAVAVDRSGASLLAAFKSQRAQSKPPPPPPQPAPSSPPADYDNDSVVEFDYEHESFEDDDDPAAANNPQPLWSVPAPAEYDPGGERSTRRMRSIFDTISQLRSRSNSSAKLLSTSPTPTPHGAIVDDDDRRNVGADGASAAEDDDVVDSPRLPEPYSPTTTTASQRTPSASPSPLEGRRLVTDPSQADLIPLILDQTPSTAAKTTSGPARLADSADHAQNVQPGAVQDPLSNRAGAIVAFDPVPSPTNWAPNSSQDSAAAALDWTISESTPRLGPIPVPDRGRDVAMAAPTSAVDSYLSHRAAARADDLPAAQTPTPASTPAPPFRDGDDVVASKRAEAVPPVCDSKAETPTLVVVTAPAGRTDDGEPVSCSSPTRRKAKTNALRHIKRKVDTGKRRRQHDDRTESVERKRIEQVQLEQEERLKELERDKFLLESQLSQLSVSVSGSFRERLNAGAPLPTSVSDSQLEDIKKEMQSMEKIIEALNEENAKLYASLRGEQISMKGTAQQMLARNKTLRSELDLAQAEIQELRAAKLTTADEGAQEEIRRLKHAIVQQRNDFDAKLRAAQAQTDSFRRKNEEIEYRLSTINYEPTSPRRQRPATPIKSKTSVEKYEKEIAELREKLQWYIENQRMIDDLQAAIDQKDESIKTLQHRVDLLYAETKAGKKKPPAASNPADARRVRDLENEIAQLKKQQPHKRAVTAMVKAANRPDPRLVQQLQKTIADLQDELAAKDADYVARMRNLRLECDKMRVQYDERLAQLLADRREQARPHERIRELEEQIEEMRDTYRRKGQRDKVSRSAQTESVRDPDRDERDADDDGCGAESAQLWHRIKMAEDQNRREQDRIHELETELAQRPVRADNDFDSVIAALNDAHASQIDALHSEIRLLTESMRKRPDALLDRTATSHLVASLQSQLDVAHRDNMALKESLIETQYELSRLRSMPTHVQISALELKLNEIEARHASREAGLRDALRQLEQQSESRSHQSSARYEAMVREKNAQINEFRAELDVLLGELTRLQQRSAAR